MMTEQIGLVIWGCKGGHRVFCSNNVVNTGESVIAQTVKDIRSAIRIHRTGSDFYAIEFTPQYKVFTNYRSSNDSGSGAFIAFTIYVPHHVKLLNMRAMFKEMMDAYFQEYMNPMSNTPLTGKYDDINKFTPIFARYEVKADKPGYRFPSAQDDLPQLVVYDDVAVVDKYFDSPYRPEFYRCQEVIFLSREIYDNPETYKLELVKKLTIIDKISEPEAESKLVNNLAGLKLLSLVINGEDMLSTNGNCPLSEMDTISFSIEKDEFNEKFVAQSFEPGKPLTVKDAVDKGWLRRKGQRDFEFAQPARWTPKKYYLPLNNTGLETEKLCGRIFLFDSGTRKLELKKTERGCCFELSGDEVTRSFSLGLAPIANVMNKQQHILLQQGIVAKDLLSQGLHTDVVSKVIHRNSRTPDVYRMTFRLPNYELKIQTQERDQQMLLPAGMLSQLSLDFEADNYDAHFDGENVSFTPAFVSLFVSKDILTDNIYERLKLKFVVGETIYESKCNAKRQQYFKLTYDHWLGLKNGQTRGKLLCNNQELDYALDKDAEKLSMYAVVITNTSQKPVFLTIQNDSGADSIQLMRGSYVVQPLNRKVEVDEGQARIFDEKSSSFVQLKKIVAVESINIPEIKEPHRGDDEPKAPKRIYSFINCQGFDVCIGSQSVTIKSAAMNLPPTMAERIELRKGDRIVCVVRPGRNENCAIDKRKDDFRVTWKSETQCDIEYCRESILEKLLKFKKVFYGVGALTLVCCLAWGGYSLLKNKKKDTVENSGPYLLTLNLNTEENQSIDSICYPSGLMEFVKDTSENYNYVIIFSVQEKDTSKFLSCLSQKIYFIHKSGTEQVDTCYPLGDLLAQNSNPKEWQETPSITKKIDFPKRTVSAENDADTTTTSGVEGSFASSKPKFSDKLLANYDFNLANINDWLENYEYDNNQKRKLEEYRKFFNCESIENLRNINENNFHFGDHYLVVKKLFETPQKLNDVNLKTDKFSELNKKLGISLESQNNKPKFK